MSEDNGIKKYRDEIDQIDQKILHLVNLRAECAIQIGLIKKKAGLPIFVPEREQEVVDNMKSQNQGPLPDEAIAELYHWLFVQMKNLE